MKKKKPIHYLGKQSITKCGWTLYTGGIIVENTKHNALQRTCIRFEAVQNTHKFGIEIKTIKKQ